MDRIRESVYAGSFYPKEKKELSSMIDSFLKKAKENGQGTFSRLDSLRLLGNELFTSLKKGLTDPLVLGAAVVGTLVKKMFDLNNQLVETGRALGYAKGQMTALTTELNVAAIASGEFLATNVDLLKTLQQATDQLGVQGDILGVYIHNNKKAVIVSLEGGNQELAKDIAMHFTAMKPEYIEKGDITEDIKKTMFEIFQKEVAGIDKPEEIKKKMLEGKISTYFKEKTLLDQPFIKNPDETIGKILEHAKAKIKEVKSYSI